MPAPIIYAVTPARVKAAGSGSAAIQVVGRYLDPATVGVTFGAVNAFLAEPVSTFLYQGTAAAHAAGAVDVVVTTAAGSATATAALTYV